MKNLPIQVVKVGGSLFDLDDLGDRIRRFLSERGLAEQEHDEQEHDEQDLDELDFDELGLAGNGPKHTVLIAGGGPLVDAVRRSDKHFRFGESKSHWLSIRAMRSTARFLAQTVPEFAFVNDYSALQERIQMTGVTIFDCYNFLREIEPSMQGMTLPESWEVTSDSIAARLSIVLAAEELVLLKSATLPSDLSKARPRQGEGSEALDRNSYDRNGTPLVDKFFDRIADNVPSVRIVNLRDSRKHSQTNLKNTPAKK